MLIRCNHLDSNIIFNFLSVMSCARPSPSTDVSRCNSDPAEFEGECSLEGKAAFLPSAPAALRPPGVQVMHEHMI